MSIASISLKIWIKALLINAAVTCAGGIVISGMEALLLPVIILIGGVLFTWPLLLLISLLVKTAVRIPYEIQARLVWLSSMLSLLSVLFYMALLWLFDKPRYEVVYDRDFILLVAATVVSVIIATITTKRSFNKLLESCQLKPNFYHPVKLSNNI